MHLSAKYSDTAVCRCSIKTLFGKTFGNLSDSTCARVSFIDKGTGLQPASLIKQNLGYHMCFAVNFAKLFKTPFW